MHVLIKKMLVIKFNVIIDKVLLDMCGWRYTNCQF